MTDPVDEIVEALIDLLIFYKLSDMISATKTLHRAVGLVDKLPPGKTLEDIKKTLTSNFGQQKD